MAMLEGNRCVLSNERKLYTKVQYLKTDSKNIEERHLTRYVFFTKVLKLFWQEGKASGGHCVTLATYLNNFIISCYQLIPEPVLARSSTPW